jgi:hypothetical protein
MLGRGCVPSRRRRRTPVLLGHTPAQAAGGCARAHRAAGMRPWSGRRASRPTRRGSAPPKPRRSCRVSHARACRGPRAVYRGCARVLGAMPRPPEGTPACQGSRPAPPCAVAPRPSPGGPHRRQGRPGRALGSRSPSSQPASWPPRAG